MAQGSSEDRAHAQAPAAGKVNARISVCIVAKDHLAGANTVGRNAGVGLQANPQVGRGSTGTGGTDNFVAVTHRNGAPVAPVKVCARLAITPIAGSKSISLG